MKNLASLLSKAVDVDKDIMKSVAAYRSGIDLSKQSRTEVLQEVEHNIRGLQLQFENYPELQSHKSVREAMQQNIYLQKEITATRDIYNDSINQ
ncbi:LemA family protein [Vibrio harveyi]|nr:LemA family protein [Vibrio harveyi]